MDKREFILVIEDDFASRLLLENYLSNCGKSILSASSGKEAVEIFEEKFSEICLVLIDIELPDISGYDLTSLIKKREPSIPIIVQSAHALHEERILAESCGCDDYISKPIDKLRFDSLIDKYLN